MHNEKLIIEVQKYPNLWDKSLHIYEDRIVWKDLWSAVAEKLDKRILSQL